MKLFPRILLLTALLFAPVLAEQQGVIVRQATLFAAADSLAERVGQLKAGSAVAILERDGGWQEVFSDKRQLRGWVRVYQVRAGDYDSAAAAEEQEDSRGFLAGLAAFSRKASGFFSQDSQATSSSTATIGVRGLSEAELSSAEPDQRELKRMIKFASEPERMSTFSDEGRLQASKVPYLPEAKE